jgi:hypothetical protein
MNFRLQGALFALLLAGTPTGAAGDFDVDLYAALLDRHTREVPDTAGVRVDYTGLRASADWRRLIAGFATSVPPTAADRSGQLAFWINAYNALAIDLVVRRAPETSIRDIGNLLRPVWKRQAGVVAGAPVTLDWIEHQLLRKLGEPRIHAAIVCASVSCPSLLREPWAEARLGAQLDAAMRAFLANPRKGLRIDPASHTLFMSRIFDWFAGDFEAGGGVLRSISPYLQARDRAWLAANPDPRIRYLDYDWRLNDLARGARDFPTAGASTR